ncbi:hypothetical protein EI546_03275 [Aequorivita sp. H23M31]|uniref:Uncharacterized protein n=1 Tax=Aequorivita ciconiae TaxID=2494375 RepID=A0A410G0K9_9FLAO|nr:hypothetical protein [Aequorivita sp. H23M31]QAA80808.1 hypothetical protein EI546_03275 [Aequorivita sp. H23M31]
MNKKEDFLFRLNAKESRRDFWQEYYDFCKDLETLDVDILFNFLTPLVERVENDGTFIEFLTGIEKASFTSSDFGNDLYIKILNQDDPKILGLLTKVLSGLYKAEREETVLKIKELIHTGDSSNMIIGLQSIAQFESESLKRDKEFLEFIEDECERFLQNQEFKNIWPSILFVCRNKWDVISNADGLIRRIWSEPDIAIQIELIYLLSYNLDINKEEQFFIEVLDKLASLNIEYNGACNILSYTLGDKTKSHPQIVINFLNKWVAYDKANAKNIHLFEYLVNSIISYDLETYEELITNWLNHDNPNFHIAVFEIMRAKHIRNIPEMKISNKLLEEMTVFDVEYITYKILGYIYDKNTSTSMVYSILESKLNDETTVNFLKQVFVAYIIFNYYGTIEYLRNKRKNAVPHLKGIIDAIIIEGEKHYTAYSELESLKEFFPSEMRLRYIHKIQNKKFNKSFKEIEKNDDSFLKYLKNIQLKAGKSSFSKYMDQYSKQMELANVSSSAELPRGEFIDPIGQKKLRLTWQNHRRQI